MATFTTRSLVFGFPSWVRLSPVRRLCDVEFATTGNAAAISLRFRGGETVFLPGNIRVRLRDVDLSDFEAKAGFGPRLLIHTHEGA